MSDEPTIKSNASSGPQERISWKWMILCSLIGACMVGAAFALQSAWHWKGVTTSVLVEGGTAFVLAGVIYLFQRRFVRTVVNDVSAATARTVERELEERIGPLETRLDDLEAEMGRGLDTDKARQDALIGQLGTPTFRNVATALAEVNHLGAAGPMGITVPASDDTETIFTGFAWRAIMSGGTWGEAVPELVVMLTPRHLPPGSHGVMPRIELVWKHSETAAAFGLRLVAELQRVNAWDEARFNWTTALRNLQRAIQIMVESRRGDGPPLSGTVLEVIDRWVLTSAGIEHLERGLVVLESDFPGRSRRSTRDEAAHESEERGWVPPLPPDGTNPEEWQLILERAGRRFPYHHGPLAAGAWFPVPRPPAGDEDQSSS